MAYGLSFQPGGDQNGQGGQNGRGQTPVQQAIQLLSLRLPSVVGARAIAPQALLNAPGGAGLGGGGMTVEAALALLRKLAQQSGMGMPPQADDIFTVPSSEQDRTGGVSRTLPQPVPRDPSGPIRVGGAPPQPAAPVIQPPSVRPGQETGEGPRQGGDPDERFKFVDGPQSFQPDPFEDVRGPRSYR